MQYCCLVQKTSSPGKCSRGSPYGLIFRLAMNSPAGISSIDMDDSLRLLAEVLYRRWGLGLEPSGTSLGVRMRLDPVSRTGLVRRPAKPEPPPKNTNTKPQQNKREKNQCQSLERHKKPREIEKRTCHEASVSQTVVL